MCCRNPHKRFCLSSARYELEKLSIKGNSSLSQPELETTSSVDAYDCGGMDKLHGKARTFPMIKMLPEQARIMRRATSNCLYAFQWRVNSFLASLGPPAEAGKKREERWQEQRCEQIEGFVPIFFFYLKI
ncbi:hypothetical protein GQ600_25583 [Phytophthora cactorum]|nr:hypothetical protein GQ600_25583 [Phytophthora cactorum]